MEKNTIAFPYFHFFPFYHSGVGLCKWMGVARCCLKSELCFAPNMIYVTMTSAFDMQASNKKKLFPPKNVSFLAIVVQNRIFYTQRFSPYFKMVSNIFQKHICEMSTTKYVKTEFSKKHFA